MGFFLTKFPEVEIQSGYLSRWNCVHHPIIFEGIRKDVQIVNFVSADPIPITVVTTSGTLPTDLVVGSSVYFQDNAGNKTGNSTVVNIVGNIVYLTKVVNFNFSAGYMNLNSRTNYSVEIEVKGVDDAGNYVDLGKLNYKPTPAGSIKINIHSLLKKLVDFGDRFQYDQINKKFKELGGRFNIRAREIWKDYEGTFRPMVRANSFFWINGTKQIQEEFNFNAGELTTFRGGVVLAKFASEFEKPTYFKGYPFSLTFIYSEKLAGRQIARVEDRFDLNGNLLSSSTDNLITSQNSSVNRLKIAEGYANNVEEVEVWLEDIGIQEIGYVGGGYWSPGLTASIPEKLPDPEESL